MPCDVVAQVDDNAVDPLNDGFLNEASLVADNPMCLLSTIQAGIEGLEMGNFSIEEMLKRSDTAAGRRSHAVKKPFLRRSDTEAGK